MLLENDKAKKFKERTLTITNHLSSESSYLIPKFYGVDSFSVVGGKKYIPFIGKGDNLPNFFSDIRHSSPTQDACIDSIASSVIGNGLIVLELDPKDVDPDFVEWCKSVNNQQDSFDDILYYIIDGEREQGNQFIEIVKGTVAGKPFLKLYLHPFQYCRFAELEPNENEPSKVVITKLFAKRGYRIKIDDARVIPLWSPNPLDQKKCWLKDEQGNFRTMLHFKNKRSGIDYYGLPASYSGLRYQIVEKMLVQYNMDNLENNMVLGGMLMFKSSMTEAEALLNAEKIMLSHIGAGKTGRIAVISSESGLEDVKYEKYDTKNEGSYMELDKRMERKIVCANKWHEILIGLNEGGNLGNGSGYIRSVWDTKEAQILNPLRRKLTDKFVMPFVKIYADVFSKPELLKHMFWFNSAMPFSFLGDINPDNFMSIPEQRDLAGLEPDEAMKGKYVKDLKSKNDVPGQPATT